MGKNRKVLIAVFRTRRIGIFRISALAAGRADPTTDTIGGQRIEVPGKFAFGGTDPFDFAPNIFTQPAITPTHICYLTAVHTQIAYKATGISGRLSRKAPIAPNPPVNRLPDFTALLWLAADTIQAQAKYVGNKK